MPQELVKIPLFHLNVCDQIFTLYVHRSLCQKSPQKAFICIKNFLALELRLCHKLPQAYNYVIMCEDETAAVEIASQCAFVIVIQLCQVWPHLKLDSSWRSLRACVF